MPYIKQDDRNLIKDTYLKNVNNAGRLNFIFTETIKSYLENKGTSYQTMNDIIGALEGAKLEFYRRIVAPYENVKINENGDVY